MSIADVFYPKKCLGCGRGGAYFCTNCQRKAKKVGQICPVCTRPSDNGKTHGGCTSDSSLDGLTSVWEYTGVVQKAIITLKYNFAKDIAQELVNAYTLGLTGRLLPKRAILVPVPMHKERFRWRGFNQADELANLFAQRAGWKVASDLVFKTRNAPAQTELKKAERRKNVLGVFSLNGKYEITSSPLPFVVFDDVWTTGTTLKEVAKVLKKGGAGTVWGLTLAR